VSATIGKGKGFGMRMRGWTTVHWKEEKGSAAAQTWGLDLPSSEKLKWAELRPKVFELARQLDWRLLEVSAFTKQLKTLGVHKLPSRVVALVAQLENTNFMMSSHFFRAFHVAFGDTSQPPPCLPSPPQTAAGHATSRHSSAPPYGTSNIKIGSALQSLSPEATMWMDLRLKVFDLIYQLNQGVLEVGAFVGRLRVLGIHKLPQGVAALLAQCESSSLTSFSQFFWAFHRAFGEVSHLSPHPSLPRAAFYAARHCPSSTKRDAAPDSMFDLIEAARDCNLTLVKTLLQQLPSTRVNERDAIGMTALHAGAMVGSLEVMTALFESNVELHSTDFRLQTPLHYAVVHHQHDAARLLIRNGASITAVDALGRTSLHVLLEILTRIAEPKARDAALKRKASCVGPPTPNIAQRNSNRKGWAVLAEYVLSSKARDGEDGGSESNEGEGARDKDTVFFEWARVIG